MAGTFCQVIDNYDPRAEQLIDDFKGEGNNQDLTIAISVDMLDTGIDVPEIRQPRLRQAGLVLRQVLADDRPRHPPLPEPVRPRPGQEEVPHLRPLGQFRVLRGKPAEAEPTVTKSLMQRLFEARIDLAELALMKHEIEVHKQTVLVLVAAIMAATVIPEIVLHGR